MVIQPGGLRRLADAVEPAEQSILDVRIEDHESIVGRARQSACVGVAMKTQK